jgi:hypothetical protein
MPEPAERPFTHESRNPRSTALQEWSNSQKMTLSAQSSFSNVTIVDGPGGAMANVCHQFTISTISSGLSRAKGSKTRQAFGATGYYDASDGTRWQNAIGKEGRPLKMPHCGLGIQCIIVSELDTLYRNVRLDISPISILVPDRP